MNKPQISIIIPVFNTQKLLRRCIDSILAQHFSDFELILINDGSTDESGEICDEYALIDKRVKVFHKTNNGTSSARNIGIKRAIGEWITFIDSDDWIEKDFLSTYIEINNGEELLSQGFSSESQNNSNRYIYQPNCSINDNLFPLLLKMYETSQLGFVWCKMFKADIISKFQIRFNPTIHFKEDLVFVVQYCNHINSIANSEKCGYRYNFPSINKKYKYQDDFNVDEFIYLALLSLTKDSESKHNLKIKMIDNMILSILSNFHMKKREIQYNNIIFFNKEFVDYLVFSNCPAKKIKIFKKLYLRNSPFLTRFLILLIEKISNLHGNK
jgi:glycosyltransferase involved in cell wall biosynthesis